MTDRPRAGDSEAPRELWVKALGAMPWPGDARTDSRCTVLVVDDDDDILASLSEHLRLSLEGVEVLTARSGDEALRVLKDASVDLALVDYQMPGMDGLELLRHIRTSHPNVKRLMLTGKQDLRLAQEAVNAQHVHSFLTKPAEPDTILRQVASALMEVLLERLRDRLTEDQATRLRRARARMAKV